MFKIEMKIHLFLAYIILHVLLFYDLVWTYSFIIQGMLGDPCMFLKMNVKSEKLVKNQYFWKKRCCSYS